MSEGDPFDFAQGRPFATPEERLRPVSSFNLWKMALYMHWSGASPVGYTANRVNCAEH